MALSKGEAAAVLSIIMTHHGNAQWDDLRLESFHSELLPDITQREALEAVRRFYRDDGTGRWCGAGDVNRIVKRIRSENRPTEAQIGREAEQRGLTEDQTWLYRRQRIRGVQPEEAASRALSARDPLQLPPVEPKPKRAGGFNPGLGMSLGQVVAGGR